MFVFPAPVSASRRVNAAVSPTLSRAIDHLFSDPAPTRPSSEPRIPAMDVVETDNAYTLSIDLPGLTREQVKVTVQARRVSIEAGSATPAPAQDGERVIYRERPSAHYARTVSLPTEVDASTSNAKFEHGVLTLTLPKRVPTGASVLKVE